MPVSNVYISLLTFTDNLFQLWQRASNRTLSLLVFIYLPLALQNGFAGRIPLALTNVDTKSA